MRDKGRGRETRGGAQTNVKTTHKSSGMSFKKDWNVMLYHTRPPWLISRCQLVSGVGSYHNPHHQTILRCSSGRLIYNPHHQTILRCSSGRLIYNPHHQTILRCSSGRLIYNPHHQTILRCSSGRLLSSPSSPDHTQVELR